MIEELVRQVARLQAQVDGLIKPELGRWIDWTPVVTQSGAVAKTIVEAKYKVSESGVRIYCQLNITGAGTAANAIVVSGWPTTINPSPGPFAWPLGVGVIVDVGTEAYEGIPIISTPATALYVGSPTTNTAIGINPNFALANGDFIYLNMYWKI